MTSTVRHHARMCVVLLLIPGLGVAIMSGFSNLVLWRKQGEADATWIFRGWEGVDAQLKGVELNTFSLDEYGVPYGYTPVLAALPQTLKCAHIHSPLYPLRHTLYSVAHIWCLSS